jgi:alkaline phosphatase
MRRFIVYVCLTWYSVIVTAQPVRIHAHNDYQKPRPLYEALRNKVFSLEADVFLINDTLKVAHDKKELSNAPSLFSLYLQPIIELFQIHQGHISSDSNYTPVLMIDIKEFREQTGGDAVLAALVKLVSPYPSVFNRSVNPAAVQLVISGERGSKWNSWPPYILFDGRPQEQYDDATLQHIAFISDSYLNYTRQKENSDASIKQVAEKIHSMKKLFRLWAIPDNPFSWEHLQQLGVDIINTDKVVECRSYFSNPGGP